jgi:hypothetical protein
MRDLKSKGLIVAKGVMFLLIAMTAGLLLWIEKPSIKTALLLALLVWGACRFYYFLFYVLEKYVDPRLQYAGLIALVSAWRRRHNHQQSAR